MDALVGGHEEIREKPAHVFKSCMFSRRTVEDKSQLHKSPILNINHLSDNQFSDNSMVLLHPCGIS